MSICGSGAALGFIDRLLFGPTQHVDYIHQAPQPDGSFRSTVYVRDESFVSTLHGSSSAPHMYERYADKATCPKNVTKHELKPLKNLDDGIACGYSRIVPLNQDGHIIMESGKVYDCKNREFLSGKDTRIMGHLVRRLRIGLLLKSVITSFPTMLRLCIILLLSGVIDTGLYELGKYMGYREAEKGRIPKKLLKAADKHAPSDAKIIASAILPIPLTLKSIDKINGQFVTPTPQQIDRLHRTLENWKPETSGNTTN